MTPLAQRKVNRLIELRRYQAARVFLRSLPHDSEAQALLSEMNTLYPDTPLEQGLRSLNSAALTLLFGTALVIGGLLLIGIVQFLQAQAAL